jgi:hypothetical protein
MSAGDQDVATGPLSHERVLDELEFLAKVEHALVVECLSVCCALGHDLDGGKAERRPNMVAMPPPPPQPWRRTKCSTSKRSTSHSSPRDGLHC